MDNNEKELTEQTVETQKPKKQTKKKSTKQETTTEPEPQVTQPEPDAPNPAAQPSEPDAPNSTPSVIEDTAINQNDLEYHTPSDQNNDNWNFYNNTQNVQTKSSKGGSNHTPSVRRNAQKRIRKAKTQRASRRINRRK